MCLHVYVHRRRLDRAFTDLHTLVHVFSSSLVGMPAKSQFRHPKQPSGPPPNWTHPTGAVQISQASFSKAVMLAKGGLRTASLSQASCSLAPLDGAAIRKHDCDDRRHKDNCERCWRGCSICWIEWYQNDAKLAEGGMIHEEWYVGPDYRDECLCVSESHVPSSSSSSSSSGTWTDTIPAGLLPFDPDEEMLLPGCVLLTADDL